MARRVAGVIAVGLVLLFAQACAPVVMTPGPDHLEPMLNDDHVLMADGARLPLRSWAPADGDPGVALVAVHGFNDYSRFFEDFGVYLAGQGVVSYAYDQRGFGAAPDAGYWAGEATYPADLRVVIDLVRARHPGLPLYVFGESMGGAVVMTAAVEAPGVTVDGLVLSAPAVWARETMPFYQRWVLGLSSHLFPGLSLSGEGLGIEPSDNIEMLREMGRDPLVIKKTRVDTIHGLVNLMDRALAASASLPPHTLILYGANDEVIRKGPTGEMLRRLSSGGERGPRIALYAAGYHMLTRDLGAETVWRDVAAWIGAPEAPLPSGADIVGATFAAEAAGRAESEAEN